MVRSWLEEISRRSSGENTSRKIGASWANRVYSRRLVPALPVRADSPNANAVVHATRRQICHPRERRRRIVLFRVRVKVSKRSPVSHIPEFHGAVAAGHGEDFALGMKRQVEHRAVVAGQFANAFSGFEIPEQDLLIVTARGESLSIGTDRDGIKLVAMPPPSGLTFPSLGPPNA